MFYKSFPLSIRRRIKSNTNGNGMAEQLKRIVRLLATDIPGELAVQRALRRIKGIGFMFARSVCVVSGVDPRKKIGLLADAELKALESAIKNETAATGHALPLWMLNRRNDPETGQTSHVLSAQLDLRLREDINTLRRIRAYKGIRHEQGQPVRGQRTRSSFRTKRAVGVMKKAIKQAAKPAPKQEAKK